MTYLCASSPAIVAQATSVHGRLVVRSLRLPRVPRTPKRSTAHAPIGRMIFQKCIAIDALRFAAKNHEPMPKQPAPQSPNTLCLAHFFTCPEHLICAAMDSPYGNNTSVGLARHAGGCDSFHCKYECAANRDRLAVCRSARTHTILHGLGFLLARPLARYAHPE